MITITRLTAFLHRTALVALAAATVLICGLDPLRDAMAADVEVYFSSPNASTSTAQPNVLFILDTSQSMYTLDSKAPGAPYDPAVTYSTAIGKCDSNRYYWATVGGLTPNCALSGIVGISASNFQCTAWKAAVDTRGFQTGLPNGAVPSRVAQGSGSKWAPLDQQNKVTACQGDGGNSGPAVWNSIKAGSYTFYRGNYLNYLSEGGAVDRYRIDTMREVVGRLVNTTSGINAGLMRYGTHSARALAENTPTACRDQWNPDEATGNGDGAPIVYPVTDVDAAGIAGHVGATVRDQIRYELGLNTDGSVMSYLVDPSVPQALQPQRVVYGSGSNCPVPLFVPGGRSPIGGAMYESYLYYSGQRWSGKYGERAAIGSTYDYPSVASARIGDRYKSPIVDACQKSFIILLSDGTTEQDNDVDGEIERLPNFRQATGRPNCDRDPYLNGLGQPPPSQCVDDMAQYLFELDLSPSVSGVQNVITYTIGFKLGSNADGDSARQLLQETAKRGGGLFYEAQDATSLESILVELIRQVLVENSSFTAPAVAINAFNRLENLDDLYIAVFRPALNYRWRGNVKKYKLQLDPDSSIPLGEILDAEGAPAVNPATGFFRDSARSLWTDSGVIDGGDITLGGAQSQISYVGRNVYSNLTGNSNVALTQSANDIEAIKSLSTSAGNALMGVQPSDNVTFQELVDWVRGKDVDDIDGDTNINENRYNFGDPLHSRPTLAIYGGSAASHDINDAVVYVSDNDDYLHAIDPLTGDELWSFVPKNLLNRTRNLFYNPGALPEKRGYGLDGTIRLVQVDTNGNGVIEPEDVDGKRDKVYLFFGQRRGGSSLYGMDVTSKTQPKLMWAISSAQLPGAGQSWSVPSPTRVDINGVSTPVLIFGGGYATTQDQLPYATDSTGNRIFMVHALTGALLWSAGPTSSGATLELAGMNNAFAAGVSVIDLTGDGHADRVYGSDLGGRIWRFDIFNGKTVTGSEGNRLIEGGLFASLGNAEDLVKTQTNTLRFFGAPDAAILKIGGTAFLNIAVGSGHREFPVTDKTTVNWFFSVRDYRILGQLLTSQYRDTCPDPATAPCHKKIVEGDLADLTSLVGDAATAAVPAGSSGWRIRLATTGEKALGESVTLQGTVLFTTFAPQVLAAVEGSCSAQVGTNQAYQMSALDARPIANRDGGASEEAGDRSESLAATGTIAPPPTIVFPPVPPGCVSAECRPSPIVYCGLEICGGSQANLAVRTYWRQRGTE